MQHSIEVLLIVTDYENSVWRENLHIEIWFGSDFIYLIFSFAVFKI